MNKKLLIGGAVAVGALLFLSSGQSETQNGGGGSGESGFNVADSLADIGTQPVINYNIGFPEGDGFNNTSDSKKDNTVSASQIRDPVAVSSGFTSTTGAYGIADKSGKLVGVSDPVRGQTRLPTQQERATNIPIPYTPVPTTNKIQTPVPPKKANPISNFLNKYKNKR